MRTLHLFAPLLLALATPALAQADGQQSDGDIWADDPYAGQDEMVLAVDRMLGAILDMPVGRLAAAIPEIADETDMDIRAGDTVRDLATREDPDFEEKARGGARAMTAVAGTMIERFRALLPELEAMGEQLGSALDE